MTTNMNQALIIWIDNLLDTKAQKFTKSTYLATLKSKDLSHSESFFKKVKKKLIEFGVEVTYNTRDRSYDIEKEDNEQEVFKILSKAQNLITLEILSTRLNSREQALGEKVQLGYSSTNSKGFKYVNTCLDAILSQRYINLTHKRFEKNAERSHKNLKPLFLKEYQNKWYLVVDPIENRDYTMFALDRIENLELTEQRFELSHKVNYSLFDQAIGVDLRDEVAIVKLKVDKEQMNYILISPLHPSQQIIDENENGMIFTLKVKLNHELKRIIMSYGSHIEVLEPAILREYIIKEFQESLNKSLLSDKT